MKKKVFSVAKFVEDCRKDGDDEYLIDLFLREWALMCDGLTSEEMKVLDAHSHEDWEVEVDEDNVPIPTMEELIAEANNALSRLNNIKDTYGFVGFDDCEEHQVEQYIETTLDNLAEIEDAIKDAKEAIIKLREGRGNNE